MEDDIRIFLARSKLRLVVLKELSEKEQIASFLAKRLGKHRETISRVFSDLQAKNLAKCKNPAEPNFRFYQITKKGKDVLEELKSEAF